MIRECWITIFSPRSADFKKNEKYTHNVKPWQHSGHHGTAPPRPTTSEWVSAHVRVNDDHTQKLTMPVHGFDHPPALKNLCYQLHQQRFSKLNQIFNYFVIIFLLCNKLFFKMIRGCWITIFSLRSADLQKKKNINLFFSFHHDTMTPRHHPPPPHRTTTHDTMTPRPRHGTMAPWHHCPAPPRHTTTRPHMDLITRPQKFVLPTALVKI